MLFQAAVLLSLTTAAIADCTIGEQLGGSAPAIVSGQFFDLDHPAQCSGNLATWELCYYSGTAPTEASEFTVSLHVWRRQGPSLNLFLTETVTATASSSSASLLTCQQFSVQQPAPVEAGDVFSVFVPSTTSTVSVIGRGVIGRALYFGGGAQTDTALIRLLARVPSTTLHVHGNIVVEETTEPPTTTQPPATLQDTTQPPATLQDTTQPPATVQETTQPPATLQDTTQPPATVQETTQPQTVTTQPPATVEDVRVQRKAAIASVLVLLVAAIITAAVVGVLLCIKHKESLMTCFKWNRSGLFAIDNILYRPASDDIGLKPGRTPTKPYDIPHDNHNRCLYNIPKASDSADYEHIDGPSDTYQVPRQHSSGYIYVEHSDHEQPQGKRDVADYEPYYSPATNESDLYQSLTHQHIHTVPADAIEVTGFLGRGQFGCVVSGMWSRNTLGKLQVAVKKLHENSSQNDKIRFLREAAIMAQFRHPNIVQLHCIVSDSEPLMLVLEYLPRGDLRKHLKTASAEEVCAGELLRFCQQVAQAVHYMASKSFVHGDIAARNIFLSMENTCKIGDFGLCVDLSEEVMSGGAPRAKLPIKWSAPEVIHLKKYSTASDVWSYGCLLYEIWSLGKKPFKGVSNTQTLDKLQKGFRLPPPPACPQEVYALMIQCWHPVAASRPGMRDVVAALLGVEPAILEVGVAPGLGGPLELGQHLHTELQQTYATTDKSSHDYEYVDTDNEL